MDSASRIEVHPDVMIGKPCIRGTHVPVSLVLERLAAGQTFEQILAEFPELTTDDITACVVYVSQDPTT